MWKEKTNKGRVVYDRPKKYLKYCDLRRLSRAMFDDPRFPGKKEYDCLADVLAYMCELFQRGIQGAENEGIQILFDYQITVDRLFELVLELLGMIDSSTDVSRENFFGGGDFGGAGASREF